MDAFLDVFPGTLPSITAAVAVLILATFLLVKRSSKRTSSLPDMARLPPMSPDSLWHTMGCFTSPSSPMYFLNLRRDMGTSVFRLPLGVLTGTHFVAVCDYQVARKILEHPGSTKPQILYRIFDQVTGGVSFFSREGARYKHVRKPVTGAFHATMLYRMHDVIHRRLDLWIETKLSTFVKKDEAFDFTAEMQRLTIAIIGEVGFEYKFNEDECGLAFEALTLAFHEFGSRCMLRPDREVFWFLSSEGRKARRAVQWLQGLAGRMLDNYRAKKARGETDHDDTIISYLDSDTQYTNDHERMCDIIVFFGAGYDTTSHTLTFIFRELARNSSEQDHLRSALQKTTTLEPCTALRNVIREAMRLFPVAALGSPRMTAEDITVNRGEMVIPQGTLTMSINYPIMRNEAVFEQPDEFIPSRWNNATRAMNESFLPFALGRRNCVGQALAKIELNTIVGRLARDYRITMEGDGSIEFHVTLKALGTYLKFTPVVSAK